MIQLEEKPPLLSKGSRFAALVGAASMATFSLLYAIVGVPTALGPMVHLAVIGLGALSIGGAAVAFRDPTGVTVASLAADGVTTVNSQPASRAEGIRFAVIFLIAGLVMSLFGVFLHTFLDLRPPDPNNETEVHSEDR